MSARDASARRRTGSTLPVYSGPFGYQQAERLLWRAGFGPRNADEVQQLAAKGLRGAVDSLLDPPKLQLSGPDPTDGEGRPIFPGDAWGHDHVWWLDRMVRTDQPLVERMTLVWHDWFATSNGGTQANLNLKQNSLLRRNALGSFRTLFTEITRDPAMLLWLSGSSNNQWAVNENYAREMMELFSLGAHSDAYSEKDIREMARALTGWVNDWSDGQGAHNFRYKKAFHDPHVKKVFGRKGRYDWRDAVTLCLQHPKHPRFLVTKLWGYFIADPPNAVTRLQLERLYRASNFAVRPLLRAILTHPQFYEGARMVKPPVVFQAGMLRALGQPIRDDGWSWLGHIAGQQLFLPPNVAGWDDTRWLDTGTFRGRFSNIAAALEDLTLSSKWEDLPPVAEADPAAIVQRARTMVGSPTLSAATEQALTAFAADAIGRLADKEKWMKRSYPVLAENAVRQLILISPDYQLC